MRRFLTILCAAVVAAPVWAGDEPTPMLGLPASRTIDLGLILPEGSATDSICIRNNGTAPLVILGASAGCNCTRVTFTRQPIAAGDSASVKVMFDAAGRGDGPFLKIVRLRTNAGNTSIFVKGEVKRPTHK